MSKINRAVLKSQKVDLIRTSSPHPKPQKLKWENISRNAHYVLLKNIQSKIYVLFYTCLQLKIMLLLSLTEDENMNPNLDSPTSNLGCLQALQFSISQILFKLLKGEKEGKKLKNKNKKIKTSRGAGKEPFLTGCGMSAFAPISLNGFPVVSYWCP